MEHGQARIDMEIRIRIRIKFYLRIRYTGLSFDLFLFRSSGKEDRRPQDEEK